MNHKRRVLSLALFAAFFSSSLFAYPLWIKIENPRSHPLKVVSVLEGQTTEIAAKSSREFMVSCPSDWTVRYRSGPKAYALGKWWNLDAKLDTFIENCARNMGDAWKTNTVKYCSFRLDELNPGLVTSDYTLTVTQILDLKMERTAPVCKMSPNEQAIKVSAAAKALPLLTEALFAESRLLYNP